MVWPCRGPLLSPERSLLRLPTLTFQACPGLTSAYARPLWCGLRGSAGLGLALEFSQAADGAAFPSGGLSPGLGLRWLLGHERRTALVETALARLHSRSAVVPRHGRAALLREAPLWAGTVAERHPPGSTTIQAMSPRPLLPHV